jgi:predicted metallopeptidase
MPAMPFNFTNAMRLLCHDVTQRTHHFAHVRMEQVATAFAQTRHTGSHGLQAKLTPLRFEQGQLTTRKRGRMWRIQRLFDGDVEMLYILTFYLPRFLNHSFREKMITVMHELYHISPRFDGDIRRLPGHHHVHSSSQAAYDRQMALIVDEYMSQSPPGELYSFLNYDFRTLQRKHGGVVGMQVAIPKLIPVAHSA